MAPGAGSAARRALPRARRGATNIFDPLDEEWWDEFSAVPDEFLDAGAEVVVLGRYRGVAKETRKQLDVPFVHVWTLRGEEGGPVPAVPGYRRLGRRARDLIIDTACGGEETRAQRGTAPGEPRPGWAKED